MSHETGKKKEIVIVDRCHVVAYPGYKQESVGGVYGHREELFIRLYGLMSSLQQKPQDIAAVFAAQQTPSGEIAEHVDDTVLREISLWRKMLGERLFVQNDRFQAAQYDALHAYTSIKGIQVDAGFAGFCIHSGTHFEVAGEGLGVTLVRVARNIYRILHPENPVAIREHMTDVGVVGDDAITFIHEKLGIIGYPKDERGCIQFEEGIVLDPSR